MSQCQATLAVGHLPPYSAELQAPAGSTHKPNAVSHVNTKKTLALTSSNKQKGYELQYKKQQKQKTTKKTTTKKKKKQPTIILGDEMLGLQGDLGMTGEYGSCSPSLF